MNLQNFIKKYGSRKTLNDIPWEDFPEELQQVCFGFVDQWLCSTPYDDMRNLSGFNNMSVYDLVRLTQAKPPRWKNPTDPDQMSLLWWDVWSSLRKEVTRVYTPSIAEDLVRKLYRLKEATRTPMTRLLDAILRDALDGVDAEIYGQGKTAACRIQVREGKAVPWLSNGVGKKEKLTPEVQNAPKDEAPTSLQAAS